MSVEPPPERPDTVMGRALARRAVDLAAAQQARRRRYLVGEWDLTRPAETVVPPHIAAAARDTLDRGETHYTSRPGLPDLRRAIARELTEEGIPATAESVVVTNGGTEALYIVLQATLSRGDRIAIVDPMPPHLVEMIRFIGAEAMPIPTTADDRFVPTIAAISAVDGAVLFLQSPSPVSGVAIPNKTLVGLIETAIERGLAVVLDRSLVTASYDADRARLGCPDLGASVFTIGSFSVGHGLSGWRVGSFSTPPDRIKPLRELKQALSICTTSVSQYAALAAVEGPREWVTERRAGFAARRDRVAAMARESGLAIVVPDAFPALLIDVRIADGDDRRFAAWLADTAGVVVAPGSDFGMATTGFVWIDLGVDDATLETGLRRLTGALKGRQQA